MTPRQARSKLLQSRLRFGDPQQIAMLNLLRMREQAMEMIRESKTVKCELCAGKGRLECQACSGRGSCEKCGRECDECHGCGYVFCSVCDGTGKAMVSMDARQDEIEDLVQSLVERLRRARIAS